MNTKQKIEEMLRTHFNIPENVEMRWALAQQKIEDEQIMHPVLLIDCEGKSLILDIFDAQFKSEDSLPGIISDVDVDIDDEEQEIVLSSDEGGTVVSLAEIEDFLLSRRYSSQLIEAVAKGKI